MVWQFVSSFCTLSLWIIKTSKPLQKHFRSVIRTNLRNILFIVSEPLTLGLVNQEIIALHFALLNHQPLLILHFAVPVCIQIFQHISSSFKMSKIKDQPLQMSESGGGGGGVIDKDIMPSSTTTTTITTTATLTPTTVQINRDPPLLSQAKSASISPNHIPAPPSPTPKPRTNAPVTVAATVATPAAPTKTGATPTPTPSPVAAATAGDTDDSESFLLGEIIVSLRLNKRLKFEVIMAWLPK